MLLPPFTKSDPFANFQLCFLSVISGDTTKPQPSLNIVGQSNIWIIPNNNYYQCYWKISLILSPLGHHLKLKRLLKYYLFFLTVHLSKTKNAVVLRTVPLPMIQVDFGGMITISDALVLRGKLSFSCQDNLYCRSHPALGYSWDTATAYLDSEIGRMRQGERMYWGFPKLIMNHSDVT